MTDLTNYINGAGFKGLAEQLARSVTTMRWPAGLREDPQFTMPVPDEQAKPF